MRLLGTILGAALGLSPPAAAQQVSVPVVVPVAPVGLGVVGAAPVGLTPATLSPTSHLLPVLDPRPVLSVQPNLKPMFMTPAETRVVGVSLRETPTVLGGGSSVRAEIVGVAPQKAPSVLETARNLTAAVTESGEEGSGGQAAVQETLGRGFDGSKVEGRAAPQSPEPVAVSAPTPYPLKLVITGPPGSGKGTHGKRLAAQYGVVHISVGDLLREYAKGDPAVAATMEKGRLVESSLVLRLVRERLAQPDVKERGFILDGFPRRPNEAAEFQRLVEKGLGLDAVILLDVPREELLRRILARGRADDNEAVFQDRMRIYEEQTVPSIETLKSQAPVLEAKLEPADKESNFAKVRALLDAFLDKLRR